MHLAPWSHPVCGFNNTLTSPSSRPDLSPECLTWVSFWNLLPGDLRWPPHLCDHLPLRVVRTCVKFLSSRIWGLVRVPWTARRSNQSILMEINPKYTLQGLTLKLKLQYFGHWCEEPTHWKRPWCWERLRAGGEAGDRGWGGWMASPSQWTWIWANSWR